MLRLTEVGLFAAPFIAFIVWRLWGRRGWVPVRVVAAAALTLAVLAVVLVWIGLGRFVPPGSPYVPARLGADGRIVGPEGGR